MDQGPGTKFSSPGQRKGEFVANHIIRGLIVLVAAHPQALRWSARLALRLRELLYNTLILTAKPLEYKGRCHPAEYAK